jgi:hypothetical protein
MSDLSQTHPVDVAKMLDTTETIVALNSEDFGDMIHKYVRHGNIDDPDAPALWPLVRKIQVHCSSPALSKGAIFVELPDFSRMAISRNEVARDYIRMVTLHLLVCCRFIEFMAERLYLDCGTHHKDSEWSGCQK